MTNCFNIQAVANATKGKENSFNVMLCPNMCFCFKTKWATTQNNPVQRGTDKPPNPLKGITVNAGQPEYHAPTANRNVCIDF
jgi:hypothetical protein